MMLHVAAVLILGWVALAPNLNLFVAQLVDALEGTN